MRIILWCALLAGSLTSGCSELEPMVEPEVLDLQLTIDTLKTQVRDTQRNMAELRMELEARRQELADAKVARAQLEGRMREAERRVAEARRVIDLQREELVAARTERERILRSSFRLQSQMKQLQKHLSKSAGPFPSAHETAPNDASGEKAQKEAQVPPRIPASPAAFLRPHSAGDASNESRSQEIGERTVSVMPGDTLWRLAHRYRVDLHRLRSLNHLADNTIVVGQTLWLPAEQTFRQSTPKFETDP